MNWSGVITAILGFAAVIGIFVVLITLILAVEIQENDFCTGQGFDQATHINKINTCIKITGSEITEAREFICPDFTQSCLFLTKKEEAK